MPIPLRQSTASQEIFLGVMVDATDGFTPETGLTVANTDIMLGKGGATSLVAKNSGGGTHTAGGVYSAVLDATDTNTLGALMIFSQPSGARPVVLMCQVYDPITYDSLFAAAGTDYLQVDARQAAGSTSAMTRLSELYLYGMIGFTVAGTPTTTSFETGLTGASYPDSAFHNAAIIFTTGSNVGLTPHPVATFTSSSGVVTVTIAFPFLPVAGNTGYLVGVVG